MVARPDLSEFSNGSMSSAIVMCGVMIVLIALLGCCGAQWDSKVFLFPYATLVTVSLLALLSLAASMYHVHGSLLTASQHNFNLTELSSGDQTLLRWIHHRFRDAYDGCGLSVDLDLTLQNREIVATCENQKFEWFAAFVDKNCHITTTDLQLGSTFLSCAGANFTLTDSITEHTMLCACESNLVSWMDDQSLLIAVFVGAVVFLEVLLVMLSCYVMCSRRGRRQGYQEIRMPLKQQQQPYNTHPRNFLYGQSNAQDPRQSINATTRATYSTLAPSS